VGVCDWVARPGSIDARVASASRRCGAVLRTHAELGLSAPGNAEP
jgi:hypothetical protein